MMYQIGIGDRQDNPRCGGAKPVIQRILNIDHGGVAGRIVLRLHPVVRSQNNGGAHRVNLAKIAVDHGVEGQCTLFFRREFVLDAIRC